MASTNNQIALCQHCQRPFRFTEMRLSYAPEELEPIHCAHCNTLHHHAKTNGGFKSEALSPEDERSWFAAHKK